MVNFFFFLLSNFGLLGHNCWWCISVIRLFEFRAIASAMLFLEKLVKRWDIVVIETITLINSRVTEYTAWAQIVECLQKRVARVIFL